MHSTLRAGNLCWAPEVGSTLLEQNDDDDDV